jgi:uncharacterized membrane protein
MNKLKALFADKDIEQFIGKQLRAGVVTASIIVLIGGLFYLVQYGPGGLPDYGQFKGIDAGFTSFGQIIHGIVQGNAKGIIQAGVMVLIATPILRIFFSLIGFMLEKDKLYIAITLVVFSVMMFSIFGGLKI